MDGGMPSFVAVQEEPSHAVRRARPNFGVCLAIAAVPAFWRSRLRARSRRAASDRDRRGSRRVEPSSRSTSAATADDDSRSSHQRSPDSDSPADDEPHRPRHQLTREPRRSAAAPRSLPADPSTTLTDEAHADRCSGQVPAARIGPSRRQSSRKRTSRMTAARCDRPSQSQGRAPRSHHAREAARQVGTDRNRSTKFAGGVRETFQVQASSTRFGSRFSTTLSIRWRFSSKSLSR